MMLNNIKYNDTFLFKNKGYDPVSVCPSMSNHMRLNMLSFLRRLILFCPVRLKVALNISCKHKMASSQSVLLMPSTFVGGDHLVTSDDAQ